MDIKTNESKNNNQPEKQPLVPAIANPKSDHPPPSSNQQQATTINETVVTSTNNNNNNNNTRNENNVTKPPFIPVIRTPGGQQRSGQQSQANQMSQVPQAPSYHAPYKHIPNPVPDQTNYDITKTVTSLVDNMEAELAKHSRRRPSFRYESRKL